MLFNRNTCICVSFLLVGHIPNYFHSIYPNFSFFFCFLLFEKGVQISKGGSVAPSEERYQEENKNNLDYKLAKLLLHLITAT